MMKKTNEFHPGDYIVYQNGDQFELGRIKRVTDDGAFVWYHDGETAAKTPYECMHKLINDYAIRTTTLGGEERVHITSIKNNTVNLCDSCSDSLPTCGATMNDIIFGDGIGMDNVCACGLYTPIAKE